MFHLPFVAANGRHSASRAFHSIRRLEATVECPNALRAKSHFPHTSPAHLEQFWTHPCSVSVAHSAPHQAEPNPNQGRADVNYRPHLSVVTTTITLYQVLPSSPVLARVPTTVTIITIIIIISLSCAQSPRMSFGAQRGGGLLDSASTAAAGGCVFIPYFPHRMRFPMNDRNGSRRFQRRFGGLSHRAAHFD
ncbi:hypothetical protein L596_001448 [Steinernema carpocapsae]|uniref:Uncharacterized protein n=1 Tax=Steinernema carpocapsae TaxID=34508 RepID=A0A4U8UMB3_STECR|nr:hypothetical protein L596_001448 [Steinernema carpocapsae]